jgi:hypothetical protein
VPLSGRASQKVATLRELLDLNLTPCESFVKYSKCVGGMIRRRGRGVRVTVWMWAPGVVGTLADNPYDDSGEHK